MQYASISDDTGTGTSFVPCGKIQVLAKHVSVQDSRCSSYDIAGQKSGTERAAISELRQRPEKPIQVAAGPARADAVRRGLARAEQEARRMEAAAADDRPVDLSNAGFGLQEQLQILWEFREQREDDWGDLLNILQGALSQEEFERFSLEQCRNVRIIVTDNLAAGSVGLQEIERSLALLTQAGLHPWKPLSHMEDE